MARKFTALRTKMYAPQAFAFASVTCCGLGPGGAVLVVSADELSVHGFLSNTHNETPSAANATTNATAVSARAAKPARDCAECLVRARSVGSSVSVASEACVSSTSDSVGSEAADSPGPFFVSSATATEHSLTVVGDTR